MKVDVFFINIFSNSEPNTEYEKSGHVKAGWVDACVGAIWCESAQTTENMREWEMA